MDKGMSLVVRIRWHSGKEANFRLTLIMCCLEGRTRDEAAAVLGCSIAAVKSRLERGRKQLRRGLERRGVQLPAAFLVLGLTRERIRAALWTKTMQSVLHTPAPAIAALADVGVTAVTMGKGKLLLAALLLLSSAAGATSLLLPEKKSKPPAASASNEHSTTEPKRNQAPQVRTDRHGDPLPKGALARLGTVRWRHGFMVEDLAYSPDGRRIAVAGLGRDITLWDANSGKEIYQVVKGGASLSLAFSPDAKILATTESLACHLWDAATGKELKQLRGHKKLVHSVAYSPDGKYVATACLDDARIWDASSGKELHKLDGKQGGITSLAFSPDGKLLATGHEDGTIRLWNTATAKEQRRLTEHKNLIFKILFSPDGKRLVSISRDRTIRLWNTATGKQCHLLGDKRGESWSAIAFSPDGKWLASGNGSGSVQFWDPIAGTQKHRWQIGSMNVQAISFSPDGKTLATNMTSEGVIRLWETATGKEQHPSDEHHGFVNLVRFSPDGASLLSLGRDRCLLRWDLAACKPTRLFSWPPVGHQGFALSPDGNTLAINGEPDFYARLWDIRTGKPGRGLGKPRPGSIWAIAFSADGRLVAAVHDDPVIHAWNALDGKEVRQFKGFKRRVKCLRFSPDGKALACGLLTNDDLTTESTLRLWDLSSGKERTHFNIHDRTQGSLAFSPDGKTLASADDNEEEAIVHLWDAATGQELRRHTGHPGTVGAIAFSPDGRLVASGSGILVNDSSVHVWEAVTGLPIRHFVGHHSGVGCVDFSPDGRTVASGGGDSTVLLWDITGRAGVAPAQPLKPRELETCWMALGNEDAARAYDAVWQLVAAPNQAIPFLQTRLLPVRHPDDKSVARWIADLDSNDFMVRQKANDELSKFEDAIAPTLRGVLQGKPSLEKRLRVQQLLDRSRDWTPERLRVHRALQVLEHIGTRPAREILKTLASGAPKACRTKEAKAALERMSR